MKLLLATNNQHKVEEFAQIFAELNLDIELLTPNSINLQLDVEENGETLQANAELKAKAFFEASGIPTIADDTGLEVYALENKPGVHSARYAGENCDSAANRVKLINALINLDDTSAQFRTAICYFDGETSRFVDGICTGRIIDEERGDGGFGYDSIFIPTNYDKTFAELSADEKNSISHRGNAVRNFAKLFVAMQKPKMRIGFLASGGGSNMQAIIDAVNSGELFAEAAVMITNNSSAGAIAKAQASGMPYLHISSAQFANDDERDAAITDELLKHKVDIVVLAGYMKKVGVPIISKFPNRILNIHPALLPDFGGEGMYGMNVHRAVIAAKVKVSGPTVHIVDSEYDKGRILAQMQVPVLDGDTPEDLQIRVLAAEHKIYADTLRKIVLGEIKIN